MVLGIGSLNPLQVALAFSNPASFAAFASTQLSAAIVQQAIQTVGQQMGLPQSMISSAQNAFSLASGTQNFPRNIPDAVSQLSDMFNLSPREQGALIRSAMDDLGNFIASLTEGRDAKKAKGGGWLMAIAEALGKKLDKQAAELENMADQLSDKKPSLTAKFGAKSQQFSMMFNATSTAIKAIGEAMSAMSRKQ